MLLTAAVAGVVAGCAASRPSEQELRAALVTQVREDAERYNQRMDRYDAPKWEIDGSSCSLMRSRRKPAVKSEEITIRETGGRTTVYDSQVPHVIETYIKSGSTEEECREAPERKLEPQRVTYKYEWDSVTKRWHQARTGGIGDTFGIAQ
ncbi:MAG TPA: hypothetical protein VM221_06880 [Armatimonadota bacterium]|nr:hypothetical protein [Armatimonadota bacterium]